MTALPSIRELGLFSYPKGSPPCSSPEPSPVFSPAFSHSFSGSFSSSYSSSKEVASLAESPYLNFMESSYQKKDLSCPLPDISSLLRTPTTEDYSLSSGHCALPVAIRRGSAESICSTPSLAGSVSTCVTTGSNRSLSPVAVNYYGKFQDVPVDLTGFDCRAMKSHKSIRRGPPPPLSIPAHTSSSCPRPVYTPSSPRSRHHLALSPQTVPLGRLVSSLTRPRGGVVKRRKPQKHEGEGHCNIKYSDEQHHFLIYCHDDLNMTWDQIKDAFSQQFPGGPTRDVAGVQSIHYRINAECPVRTEDNLLVFGEPEVDGDGQKRVDAHGKAPRFNQYDNMVFKALIRTTGKVSLIDRYAEQVVEYNWSWIKPADMQRARDLAARRRPYRQAWEARKQAKKAESNSQVTKSDSRHTSHSISNYLLLNS